MGSNMAENHPVAFRWPMKAKVEHGAKIIHIDPRFTRTSAVADIYAPVRAGSDIAFLGGVINYVINSERWNKDPFFQTFVVNYTNAATLLREDFKDTEDLDGAFSGLEPAKGGGARLQDLPTAGVAEWPFNGFINQYNRASWEYAREKPPAVSAKPVELKPGEGFAPLVASLVWAPPLKDETLQNPRCVFQTVKRHFARYTPEMVEKTTGCPKETFLKVAADHFGQFRRGTDDFLCLRGRLDAAHVRGSNHRRLRAVATSARQHRPAWGRRHGAPRPRLDSGLDGYSDALSFDPRLYECPVGAQEARNAPGFHRHRDDTLGLLGEPAEVHGFLP